MSDVPRETSDRLQRLVELVTAENARQNLIAASTLEAIEQRHIADSLQLLEWDQPGLWLDVGTGGGFPGLVVAATRSDPVLLVEPRTRRADFLRSAAADLGLDHVSVVRDRIERVPPAAAAIISARAVAPLADLLALSHPHAAPGCTWLLPKGRSAAEELAMARGAWQGDFRLIPSRTDAEASIVLIRDLAPRRSAGRR